MIDKAASIAGRISGERATGRCYVAFAIKYSSAMVGRIIGKGAFVHYRIVFIIVDTTATPNDSIAGKITLG